MKKTFTKQYIIDNKGCYHLEQVEKLPFINNKSITITTLLNGLPVKDFNWFLIRKCELTISQKKNITLMYAETVLPIYEEKHPEDKRVRECIQGIKDFNNGKTTKEELIVLRNAASAAVAAVAAASAAVADADADAYAAASAAVADAYAAVADADAYAADADAYAADAADAAADAADAKKWQKTLKTNIINWIKEN